MARCPSSHSNTFAYIRVHRASHAVPVGVINVLLSDPCSGRGGYLVAGLDAKAGRCRLAVDVVATDSGLAPRGRVFVVGAKGVSESAALELRLQPAFAGGRILDVKAALKRVLPPG